MATPTTLNEACAPIFLFLTTFRRNAATSKTTIQELKTLLKREFDKVRQSCEREARLLPLYERARYALVATADQVVLSSAWSQRAGWSMSLLETEYFGRAEGGKQFYRDVEEVLGDPSDAGAELAVVLFTCMALGFQGELLGERRELDARRRQLYEKARLPGAMGEHLSPDAYGHNADRSMPTLPTVGIIRMVGITVAALGFALLAGRVTTSAVTQGDRGTIEKVIGKLEDPELPAIELPGGR